MTWMKWLRLAKCLQVNSKSDSKPSHNQQKNNRRKSGRPPWNQFWRTCGQMLLPWRKSGINNVNNPPVKRNRRYNANKWLLVNKFERTRMPSDTSRYGHQETLQKWPYKREFGRNNVLISRSQQASGASPLDTNRVMVFQGAFRNHTRHTKVLKTIFGAF